MTLKLSNSCSCISCCNPLLTYKVRHFRRKWSTLTLRVNARHRNQCKIQHVNCHYKSLRYRLFQFFATHSMLLFRARTEEREEDWECLREADIARAFLTAGPLDYSDRIIVCCGRSCVYARVVTLESDTSSLDRSLHKTRMGWQRNGNYGEVFNSVKRSGIDLLRFFWYFVHKTTTYVDFKFRVDRSLRELLALIADFF